MKNELPLVSVIIPCFNAEKFVEDAVHSIMQQSYPNLEVIAIDDCSTDSTLNVLKKLCAEDARIKLLMNEKNLGLVSTLNKGIHSAEGKYIARMDADDISHVNRIMLQVNFLEANDDVAMCGGNYILIDEQGTEKGKLRYPPKNEDLKAELLFYCPFCHPSVMMRKKILSETGLYGEGLVPAEDYELWLRIAEKFPVENLTDYLLYYRWHGSNASITRKQEKYEALSKVVNRHSAYFGPDEKFLCYHLKFLAGLWYEKTSREELNGFSEWKEYLFTNISQCNKRALNKTFYKYYSLALLSILKSHENSLSIKFMAATKLLTINPVITIKHFFR